MGTGHRVALTGAVVLVAGQGLLILLYGLLFLPLLAGGTGPDDPEETGTGSGSAVAVAALVCVAAAVAADGWVALRLGRALRGAARGPGPVTVGIVVQALLLAGSLAVRLTPLALTCAPVLLVLVCCRIAGRPRASAPAGGLQGG